MKVLIYDATEKSFVGRSWKTGAKLFGRKFDVIIPARSWNHAFAALEAEAPNWKHIQFWGHGSPGDVWINGKTMANEPWNNIRMITLQKDRELWFRCCSFPSGKYGKRRMKQVAKNSGATVYAFTTIIGAIQAGLVYCTPDGYSPYDPMRHIRKDNPNRTVWGHPWMKPAISVLTMSIPERFKA